MRASISTGGDAKSGVKPLHVSAKGPDEGRDEWWVGVLRWAALAVFVAIPVGALFAQKFAGRAVWTVGVASVPLFIVLVGYHRWRRICPLAFFAQLPTKLGWQGKRKAPAWLEQNYYYLVVAIFVLSLWLRLIATNGDGRAISTFFALLSLSALVSGFVFTGKTWCNYICPVSFVEKIYTEPNGIRETPNSQCAKCTACKKFCPDINEENGYWKEIGSLPKRLAYFAFPGLVFGFYFYYYLQSGAWSYYFDGRWTDEPRVYAFAFATGTDATSAGLFFYPAAPRALASLLTLALCGLASFALFSALERGIDRWMLARAGKADAEQRRHLTFSLAAFSAFVTFYTFAGAPTLWKLPWAVPHLFLIVVAVTATGFLIRRLSRTQKRFAEETLARNIVKRWDWPDHKAPKDLREAFLVHTIRTGEMTRNAARVLEIYKEAVRDALSEGFVSREDVQKLEQLRQQLDVKKGDHDKVMASLAADERALLGDPTRHLSPEKFLQLKSYERALGDFIASAPAGEDISDGDFVSRLRREYRVTKAEHDAVLDMLAGSERILAARLAEELHVIERAAATIRKLDDAPVPLSNFLSHLLRRRHATAVVRLLNVVGLAADEESVGAACRKLSDAEHTVRRAGIEELSRSAAPSVAEYLKSVYLSVADYETFQLDDLLQIYTGSVDPYVRAASILLLSRRGAPKGETFERLKGDEYLLVREVVASIEASARAGSDTDVGLTTLEKMVALHAVDLFSTLDAEELYELALACKSESYPAGAVVCSEGERGDKVFIILEGYVRVVRGEGASASTVSIERAGSVLGEMAVLDSAPRAATILTGDEGARVLHLDGRAFLDALHTAPSMASALLSVMARRLRNATGVSKQSGS